MSLLYTLVYCITFTRPFLFIIDPISNAGPYVIVHYGNANALDDNT